MKFVKITKKMQILLIFSSLIAITLFSCASTPKEEDLSLQNQNQSEINKDDDKTQDENINENENPLKNQNELTSEENLSDLEEPLTNEQNPVLPELPEVKNNENNANNSEEPIVLAEPDVKDVPVSEAANKNQTDKPIEENKNVQNNQNDLAESLNNNKTNSNLENDNLENNNSENSNETEIADETENQNENAEISENQTEPGTVETIPEPSRSVSMKKNQIIDITYPGKGWIYQGNIDSEGNVDSRSRNFIFNGRKLGGKDTSFTLRSRNAGTYLLHFFKNDTLTGNYIDDYLEVVVQDENNSSTEHITAPNYAEIVPPKATITAEKIKAQKKAQATQQEEQSENALENEKSTKKEVVATSQNNSSKSGLESENASAIDTIIQTTESSPNIASPVVSTNGTNAESSKTSALETTNSESVANSTESSENISESQNLEGLSEDALLDTAQKYYDEKKYPEAFTAISKFFDKATKRLDEGLYLQGRILEEKSSVQNIKNAIESYDLVVNNYPSSSLWDKANKRSIFLKRFYINIR